MKFTSALVSFALFANAIGVKLTAQQMNQYATTDECTTRGEVIDQLVQPFGTIAQVAEDLYLSDDEKAYFQSTVCEFEKYDFYLFAKCLEEAKSVKDIGMCLWYFVELDIMEDVDICTKRQWEAYYSLAQFGKDIETLDITDEQWDLGYAAICKMTDYDFMKFEISITLAEDIEELGSILSDFALIQGFSL